MQTKNKDSAPRRVLITRLTAMGDVAMTAPIVASVCKANPNVEFHVLSTPFFEPFFDASLPNFRFIGTDIRKQKGSLRPIWHLYKELKANGYTDVVDLHNVLRTQVLRTLFWFSGCKVKALSKGRSEKRALVSGRSRQQLTLMTTRYADLFRKAGFHVPYEREVRAAMPLPACVPQEKNNEKWIGVSPFAQHKGKMYPAEKMAQVIDGLLARTDVRLFIFGGGETEKKRAVKLIAGLKQGAERCHNMIGVCRLADEMALMSNLDCMISMDSSAMHVCSIFGVRVVSVWGATHPFAGFLGYGQSEADVVQIPNLDCRPCSVYGNMPCRLGDYRCFNIDPRVVVNRVLCQ